MGDEKLDLGGDDRGQGFPVDRGHVLTEQRLEASMGLDGGSIGDTLRVINDADAMIAKAVRAQMEAIEAFTAKVVSSFSRGGRLVYVGAGTSGRLGVLDASECPPTFNSDPSMVVGLIAGGDSALRVSSEHKEDRWDGAVGVLEELGIGRDDTVLGIAAGGTTPYALGGVEFAKSRGCSTGLLTCSVIDQPAWCDVLIAVETGPEVLTGSTRMKAGTATKMVLNMITTGAMVHSGKVYSNLMVDLRATNDKLRDRAARVISTIGGVDREKAFGLLDRADGEVKVALVMHVMGVEIESARAMLSEHKGELRGVIGDVL